MPLGPSDYPKNVSFHLVGTVSTKLTVRIASATAALSQYESCLQKAGDFTSGRHDVSASYSRRLFFVLRARSISFTRKDMSNSIIP